MVGVSAPPFHIWISVYICGLIPQSFVMVALYANVERVTLAIDSSTRHKVKALPISRQNYPDDSNLLMSQGQ